MWEANYTSGLHILDAANIGTPPYLQLVASFDTYTANNNRSYDGAWNNYPYFASGIVIMSSISEGLFVLRPRLSVDVKVMLGGPFDEATGMMHDSLRVQEVLPLTEPYTGLGYVHSGGGGGETTTNGVLSVTGPNAIVDWVLVELRDANNPAIVIASRSALLQRDGDIVGVNGTSLVQFTQPVKDYYLAVRHRNHHLGVMTDDPVRVSIATRSYDFTDGSTPVYGTEATKLVGDVQVLWAGNCLNDATLRYTGQGNDHNPSWWRSAVPFPTSTTAGYLPTDVNMDGHVRYVGFGNDRDPILQNVGGTVPTAIRPQQLP